MEAVMEKTGRNRGGRPRMQAGEKKDAMVSVPFTPEDRARVVEFCQEMDIPVGMWMRGLALREMGARRKGRF